MFNRPFHPTRACPHRLCPHLHFGLLVLGTVALAQILFTGIASVLFMIALVAISLGVTRLLTGKSFMQQAMDDTLAEAVGVQLVVRPGWALVAVGCDAFYVLNAGIGVAFLFAHPHTSSVPDASMSGFIVVGVVIGLMAFSQFAHRQATRPARPKRMTVPALGSTT